MAKGNLTVSAPVADYSGVVAGVSFTDGKGEVEAGNRGALDYFRRNGYGLGGDDPTPAEPEAPVDSRDLPGIVAQPPSNDAAVVTDAGGPDSDAFLPPANAGEADPHGPEVVSPGLHAVGPNPLVPGEVSPDAAKQEKKETAAAVEALVRGERPSEQAAAAKRTRNRPRS